MQYAIVDSQRREAFRSGRGRCPLCGSEAIAKCGPRVMHHWAHAGLRNCDPWWENETPWHREWKGLFPENCRELSHTAPDGEIHRADIKTPSGIFIEVQHSAITDAERRSRELFYRNLVWVIDGSVFRGNFDVFHMLPDPNCSLAQDLVWSKATRHTRGAAHGLFFRLSENPSETKATLRGGWIHSIADIETEITESYKGHHQYDWIRPRRTWLDALCPVYVDFGETLLAKLEIYDESKLPCIRWVDKRKFVHDAMVEDRAEALATRFYPIPGTTR